VTKVVGVFVRFSCAASPGIDADYRGEIGVILVIYPIKLSKSKRSALHLIIAKHDRAEWVEVQKVSQTARGGDLVVQEVVKAF
jgi:dUTPase